MNSTEIKSIPLSRVVLTDDNTVSRKRIARYSAKYVEGVNMDPVLVVYCSHDDIYHIIDGHHRTVAQSILKRRNIEATVELCPAGCDGNGWVDFDLTDITLIR